MAWYPFYFAVLALMIDVTNVAAHEGIMTMYAGTNRTREHRCPETRTVVRPVTENIMTAETVEMDIGNDELKTGDEIVSVDGSKYHIKRTMPRFSKRDILRSFDETVDECCTHWMGESCNIPICNPACESYQICSAGGVCKCPKGMEGDKCDQPIDIDMKLKIRKRNSMDPTYQEIARAERIPSTTRVCGVSLGDVIDTFDDKLYYLKGNCRYFLAENTDSYDPNSFNLFADIDEGQLKAVTYRQKDQQEISFYPNSILKVNKKEVSLPYTSEYNINVDPKWGYLILTNKMTGLSIYYDGQNNNVYIHAPECYKEKMRGLCGNFDGDAENDISIHGVQISPNIFANSLREERCVALEHEAENIFDSISGDEQPICQEIIYREFSNCLHVVNERKFLKMCVNDVNNCPHNDTSVCTCRALTEYSRACAREGYNINWRSERLCDQTCGGGMEWSECGNICPRKCDNFVAECSAVCVDGCQCPLGRFWNGLQCVEKSSCSCSYGGKVYEPDEIIRKGCNTCKCTGAYWECTDHQCPGTCSITGKLHGFVITFDGSEDCFVGGGIYLLAGATKVACEADPLSCFKIWIDLRAIDFENPPMAKAAGVLKFQFGQHAEKYSMDSDGKMTKAGEPISFSDVFKGGISSTDFGGLSGSTFQILTHNGVTVKWDGKFRIYITLDSNWIGKVQGICGDFNEDSGTGDFGKFSNVKDNAQAFNVAPILGTEDLCKNPLETGVCAKVISASELAVKHCSLLKKPDGPFHKCHDAVNFDHYYKLCLSDVCNVEFSEDISGQSCQSFAAYSTQCGMKNVIMDKWHYESEDCVSEFLCDANKKYRFCHKADSVSTCKEISFANENSGCTEGCFCTNETIWDEEKKECVNPNECPCYHGLPGQAKQAYAVGSMIEKPPCEMCYCTNAALDWVCEKIPSCVDTTTKRECTNGRVETDCACRKTCANYDMMDCDDVDCEPGCQCEGDLVEFNGECIESHLCPCMYLGDVYRGGQTVMQGCKECICGANQEWICPEISCPGVCRTHGGSHYLTYDSKRFHMTGNCWYDMSTDHCGNTEGTFRIRIENVFCGAEGYTCAKGVKIEFLDTEIILMTGTYPIILNGEEEVTVTQERCGMFLKFGAFASSISEGIQVFWDQSNTVIIRVDASYAGNLCGLCSNFNGKNVDEDEYKLRDGSSTDSPQIFAESWVDEGCTNPTETDQCEEAGIDKRLKWAEKECAIIKSDLFKDCHNQLPPTTYYEDCVYDASRCDRGGDCKCLCDAIAAYAQRCVEQDKCIEGWRAAAKCPCMDCPEGREYYPCGVKAQEVCNEPPIECPIVSEGCYCPLGMKLYQGDCVQECPTPSTVITTAPTTTTSSSTTEITTASTTATTTPSSTTTTSPPSTTTSPTSTTTTSTIETTTPSSTTTTSPPSTTTSPTSTTTTSTIETTTPSSTTTTASTTETATPSTASTTTTSTTVTTPTTTFVTSTISTTSIPPSTTTAKACYEKLKDIPNMIVSERLNDEDNVVGSGFNLDFENDVTYGTTIKLCSVFMEPVDLTGLDIKLSYVDSYEEPDVVIGWTLEVTWISRSTGDKETIPVTESSDLGVIFSNDIVSVVQACLVIDNPNLDENLIIIVSYRGCAHLCEDDLSTFIVSQTTTAGELVENGEVSDIEIPEGSDEICLQSVLLLPVTIDHFIIYSADAIDISYYIVLQFSGSDILDQRDQITGKIEDGQLIHKFDPSLQSVIGINICFTSYSLAVSGPFTVKFYGCTEVPSTTEQPTTTLPTTTTSPSTTEITTTSTTETTTPSSTTTTSPPSTTTSPTSTTETTTTSTIETTTPSSTTTTSPPSTTTSPTSTTETTTTSTIETTTPSSTTTTSPPSTTTSPTSTTTTSTIETTTPSSTTTTASTTETTTPSTPPTTTTSTTVTTPTTTFVTSTISTTSIPPSTTTAKPCDEKLKDIPNMIVSERLNDEDNVVGSGFNLNFENDVTYGTTIKLCSVFMEPVDLTGLDISLSYVDSYEEPDVVIGWTLEVTWISRVTGKMETIPVTESSTDLSVIFSDDIASVVEACFVIDNPNLEENLIIYVSYHGCAHLCKDDLSTYIQSQTTTAGELVENGEVLDIEIPEGSDEICLQSVLSIPVTIEHFIIYSADAIDISYYIVLQFSGSDILDQRDQITGKIEDGQLIHKFDPSLQSVIGINICFTSYSLAVSGPFTVKIYGCTEVPSTTEQPTTTSPTTTATLSTSTSPTTTTTQSTTESTTSSTTVTTPSTSESTTSPTTITTPSTTESTTSPTTVTSPSTTESTTSPTTVTSPSTTESTTSPTTVTSPSTTESTTSPTTVTSPSTTESTTSPTTVTSPSTTESTTSPTTVTTPSTTESTTSPTTVTSPSTTESTTSSTTTVTPSEYTTTPTATPTSVTTPTTTVTTPSTTVTTVSTTTKYCTDLMENNLMTTKTIDEEDVTEGEETNYHLTFPNNSYGNEIKLCAIFERLVELTEVYISWDDTEQVLIWQLIVNEEMDRIVTSSSESNSGNIDVSVSNVQKACVIVDKPEREKDLVVIIKYCGSVQSTESTTPTTSVTTPSTAPTTTTTLSTSSSPTTTTTQSTTESTTSPTTVTTPSTTETTTSSTTVTSPSTTESTTSPTTVTSPSTTESTTSPTTVTSPSTTESTTSPTTVTSPSTTESTTSPTTVTSPSTTESTTSPTTVTSPSTTQSTTSSTTVTTPLTTESTTSPTTVTSPSTTESTTSSTTMVTHSEYTTTPTATPTSVTTPTTTVTTPSTTVTTVSTTTKYCTDLMENNLMTTKTIDEEDVTEGEETGYHLTFPNNSYGNEIKLCAIFERLVELTEVYISWDDTEQVLIWQLIVNEEMDRIVTSSSESNSGNVDVSVSNVQKACVIVDKPEREKDLVVIIKYCGSVQSTESTTPTTSVTTPSTAPTTTATLSTSSSPTTTTTQSTTESTTSPTTVTTPSTTETTTSSTTVTSPSTTESTTSPTTVTSPSTTESTTSPTTVTSPSTTESTTSPTTVTSPTTTESTTSPTTVTSPSTTESTTSPTTVTSPSTTESTTSPTTVTSPSTTQSTTSSTTVTTPLTTESTTSPTTVTSPSTTESTTSSTTMVTHSEYTTTPTATPTSVTTPTPTVTTPSTTVTTVQSTTATTPTTTVTTPTTVSTTTKICSELNMEDNHIVLIEIDGKEVTTGTKYPLIFSSNSYGNEISLCAIFDRPVILTEVYLSSNDPNLELIWQLVVNEELMTPIVAENNKPNSGDIDVSDVLKACVIINNPNREEDVVLEVKYCGNVQLCDEDLSDVIGSQRTSTGYWVDEDGLISIAEIPDPELGVCLKTNLLHPVTIESFTIDSDDVLEVSYYLSWKIYEDERSITIDPQDPQSGQITDGQLIYVFEPSVQSVIVMNVCFTSLGPFGSITITLKGCSEGPTSSSTSSTISSTITSTPTATPTTSVTIPTTTVTTPSTTVTTAPTTTATLSTSTSTTESTTSPTTITTPSTTESTTSPTTVTTPSTTESTTSPTTVTTPSTTESTTSPTTATTPSTTESTTAPTHRDFTFNY
ncbi:uncharacterized protein [Amphiura filiformis]|uniref:uncharacterized protein isoform X3 n=1 Tax=Amphiura filiformis TaxID=82378 RepID=UPI003B2121CD